MQNRCTNGGSDIITNYRQMNWNARINRSVYYNAKFGAWHLVKKVSVS